MITGQAVVKIPAVPFSTRHYGLDPQSAFIAVFEESGSA